MSVKYIAKIALPLLLICVITVAALAAVNMFTSPRIAANEKEELDRNMASFFGDGISATDVDASELTDVKKAYKVEKDGVLQGYAFDVTGKGGYKGKIEVLVAVGTDGKVIGVSNVNNGETPSIGGKVLERADETYKGKDADHIGRGVDVEFTSGATKTSTALNNAIRNALDAYAALVGRK